METLVLGGSGLIGNAIVRALLARGHRVAVLGRRAAPPANLEGLAARYVQGDIDAPGRLDASIRGHDLVVDAAAPYALNLFVPAPPAARRPLEHAKSRTRALLEAVERHGAALAYVGTLLTRRRGSGGRDPIAELRSRAFRYLQPYFDVKAAIEEQISAASRAGLRALVVRPSVCFGPWDVKPRHQCWLPAVVRGEIPLTLQHRVNVIDSRDFAAALVFALERERFGEPIDVTGHNTSVGDVLRLACEAAGVERPAWSVPAVFGVLPALWAETAWAALGRPSPLPSLVPMLLCEQEWESRSDAQRELGLGLRPLRETVADAIAWYRTIGYC